MATAAQPNTPAPVPGFDASASRAARRRALQLAAKALRSRLRLPPKLTLSEWADTYRVLSAESSAQPGPWRTDRAPYLREIMDTMTSRECQDGTLVKCSQSGGSEVILNLAGFYMDQEPSSILIIQPNVKPMGEAFSKSRIAPMIRDCERLRGKVKDPRSRDSGNTIMQKSFPGGTLFIMGANSPAGLASNPIRVVLADELDRWPASAGTEGDPLGLADARQITYRHRKKRFKVSSPGNEGQSRIEKEWRVSDQRHFYVPCPHCGHEQPLEWRDSGGKPDITAGRGDYRLVWEKDVEGELVAHRPETAAYVCCACGCLIEEVHKPAMLAAGRWVKHNPASRLAGWHISGLLSPWVRWSDLARQWLTAKDDEEQRRTFFNTKLGLLYSSAGEALDPAKLSARREAFAAEVPMPVAALTAGVDVQGDRLEVLVVGWGAGEECWLVRLERIMGDPEGPEVWERLQAVLDRPWTHEGGADLRIRAAFVDSGYAQDAVFRFVKTRQARGVFASKGADNAKQPLSRATRANRDGIKAYTINPVAFKDTLFGRLKRQHAGPGYLHFGPEEATGLDEAFFQQLGAEKRRVDFVKGRSVVSYKAIRKRNEAIDLYVLNLGALRSLGLTFSQHLGQRAAEIKAQGEALKAATATPAPDESAPPTEPPAKRRPGGGWMRGYR